MTRPHRKMTLRDAAHWCLLILMITLVACGSDRTGNFDVSEEGRNNESAADVGVEESDGAHTTDGADDVARNDGGELRSDGGDTPRGPDEPCLLLSHEDEIAFGDSTVGQTSEVIVTIQNCTTGVPLEVHKLKITDDGGGVYAIRGLPTPSPSDPLILTHDELARFVVSYTPTDETASTGELTIQSDDPVKPELRVPIFGRGTSNSCPIAVAEARLTGGDRWTTRLQTTAQQTVEFRATNSTDAETSIERYEWSFLERPADSTSQLAPSSSAARPTLFLDVPGFYELGLRVFDAEKLESCEIATVGVEAAPD